ncbi:hypothetical protein [Faecalibacterium wellingii]|uniref:hypothetical protein n=1 Tax=Faecalibacterium wellingii TaxID=2929491 RepID=UPI00403EA136
MLRKVFICGTEWIVFFFYQIFKRDFPLAAAPYAPGCVYGSVANNSLAKGIVCMQTDEILRISPYRDGFITCSEEGIYGTKQHAFPKRRKNYLQLDCENAKELSMK